MPVCRKCSENKEQTSFPKNTSYKSGYASICKLCHAKQASYYRTVNPVKRFAKKYKVSEELIVSLYSKQMCEICGITKDRRALCIDHCHVSGKVRGLLCDSCNTGLGKFKDNVDFLKKAIEYLECK